MIIQIPDNKFVALMGMKHGKADKIIIADSYEEIQSETLEKDMISMIHYKDNNPNLEVEEDDTNETEN